VEAEAFEAVVVERTTETLAIIGLIGRQPRFDRIVAEPLENRQLRLDRREVGDE
jgi:hypothetical protein